MNTIALAGLRQVHKGYDSACVPLMQVELHAWRFIYSVMRQLLRHNANLLKPSVAIFMSAASFSYQLEPSNQS